MPTLQERIAADSILSDKFFKHLAQLVNAFGAQNPGSANAVLSVLLGTACRSAMLVGMQRSEWVTFAAQMWDDEKALQARGGKR